jgi:hypothetical protein
MTDDEVELLPPAQRDQKGRLLPGQRSINPNGRPPAIRDVKEAAKAHTRQALNTLVSVMNNADAPPAARVAASEAILNRGWGKAMQNVEARIDVTDTAAAAASVLHELTQRAKQRKIDDQRRLDERIIDVTPSSTLN